MIYPAPHPEWLSLTCSPTILEHTNDLISLLDLEQAGSYAYASASYQRVLGYDPASLIGQPPTLLAHNDDLAALQQHLVALTEHRAVQSTMRYRHVDGSWRWVETRWHRIQQHGGAYALAIGRDVTERQDLERRLSQMQKLNSLGRLAAGAAHDFHNVLAGISGFATLALGGLPADSEIRADIEEILRASERASSLTEQLLCLARRDVSARRLLDLNDLIASLARWLHRLLGEDIELQIIPAANRALVQADPNRLEQVLINLAVNARDAMPFGGQLTFETNIAPSALAPGQPSAEAGANRYVTLSVSDTGIGMEADTLARVFEPFFTARAAGGGTGLGLAICDEIVQQHGGWIHAASQPGEGSTFSIYLPLLEHLPAQLTTSTPTSDELPGGTETLLLVEDDKAVRSSLARLLHRQGYQVLTAWDGDQALALACATPERIDLLLADLVLPKLDGKVLAQQLRAYLPGLPAILLSGYPESVVANYRPFEAIVVLPKPVDYLTLLRSIRGALDGQPPS